MKKTYLSPETIIVTLEMQGIMAGSANGTTVYNGEASSETPVLSRHNHSVWDDEEGDYGDD